MKYSERRCRHTITMLTDHMVFTPKYRAPILVGAVGRYCDSAIREVCANVGATVLDLAVNVDHVHLFLRYPPEVSASKLAEKIKTNTSRELREKFPELRAWCRDALWAPGCYHGSVGQGFDVVERYISAQRSEDVAHSERRRLDGVAGGYRK
jgi:putative transposase